MKTIIDILRALVALFVDDELLAVGVVGVVGLAALMANVVGTESFAAGGTILLCGNLLVLVAGVVRTAGRR